jgi:hypothetical protein
MNGFDIILDERTRLDVPEEDLRWLLRKGRIQARTPCRSTGEKKWSELSACLPHLNLQAEAPVPSKRIPSLIVALAGCLCLGCATLTGFWLRAHAGKTALPLPVNYGIAEIRPTLSAPVPIVRAVSRPQYVANVAPLVVLAPRSAQIPAVPPAREFPRKCAECQTRAEAGGIHDPAGSVEHGDECFRLLQRLGA